MQQHNINAKPLPAHCAGEGPMAEAIHPFYALHRGAMEAAMRHRLDLAEAMLRERAHLSNIDGIRQEI